MISSEFREFISVCKRCKTEHCQHYPPPISTISPYMSPGREIIRCDGEVFEKAIIGEHGCICYIRGVSYG